MPGLLVAVILLLLVSALCLGAVEGSKHLFILSGQSNMACMDPEETFAPAVCEALGSDAVIVVKDAQGGQSIRRWYRDWISTAGDRPESTGDLYDQLMAKVRTAIQGERLASVSLVWMQGERDAREGEGTVYRDSLLGLVSQVRRDLERDDVTVVIGRLSDHDLADRVFPHWTRIREIQVALAEADPRWAWVDTDDLNDGIAEDGSILANDLHYSVEGYRLLGERFAQAALELIRRAERSPADPSAPAGESGP